MKLTIDNDKIGYIRLPNGVILQTVSGVINTIYTGVGGRITYYVPKDNANINIDGCDIAGNLTLNADSSFSFAGCTHITGLNSQNGLVFNFGGSNNFANFVAPKATTIYGTNCALTAKSIGDILYAAYADNRANVNFNFSGGTNAAYGAIDDYLINTYSVDIDTVVTALDVTGTIQLNP